MKWDKKVELWHQKNALNYILKEIEGIRRKHAEDEDRTMCVELDEFMSFVKAMIQEIDDLIH